MKVKLKSIICIIIALVILMVISPKVHAADGLIIAFSESTASVGDTVTVTVTGNNVTGSVNLSVSGNATLSQNSVSVNNGSASVTATINGEGPIRITATAAEMTNSTTQEAYTGSTGGTITVASTTATSTSTTTKQSSNANLNNLGIRPNDFTGFTPSTTTYNVTVPEDVESVEVYATAADSKATISGVGTKTLQTGLNTLEVVVTAENGTTKTYTINVTKEGDNGQTEENTEVKKGLSNIRIADLQLNPSFATDVYQYTVKYIGQDTALDIQTVATDPSYTVEILGNEDLKEGDNIVTILVADEQGNNVATYQVTINKSLVDEEAIAKQEEEKEKQEQRKMLMIAGGIIVVILIIIIAIIIKRRRNRAYAEEFSGVPFAGLNDDDDYYDDYDNHLDNNYHNEDLQANDDSQKQEDTNYAKGEENKEDTVQSQEQTEKSESNTSNMDPELAEKERAKKEFLNSYNSEDDEEDRPRRGKRKGKRFK